MPDIFCSPVHYRPDGAILADTIPFFHDGVYHIFYLRAGQGGTPWAHVSSRDLVHWDEHPDALPVGASGEPDGENVFTGSVIENDGVFHIFYTGWNPQHPDHRECVMHATSPDLIHWTKRPGDTFPADGVHYQNRHGEDFRDPFVFWNVRAGCWEMLLCCRRPDGTPVTGVATSSDLTHWEQRAPLCDGWPGTPECPDLFAAGDHWYLLASPMEDATVWRWAKESDGPWSEAPFSAIDTPILYAAKRMWDGRRHVLTGWLRDLEGGVDAGGYRWGGTQSIPREVVESAPGQLGFRPVPEARAPFSTVVLERGAAPAPQPLAVPAHYRLEVSLALGDAPATVRFRADADGASGYPLTITPATGEVALASGGRVFSRCCAWDRARPLRIEAFVLGSLIECFVNETYAFSCRAYDFPDGALEVSGEGARIESLRVTVAG